MNRPISDLPDVNILGAWALSYWLDAPEITITTNQGETRHRFTSDGPDRNGVPYTFPLEYVWRLYEANQAGNVRGLGFQAESI